MNCTWILPAQKKALHPRSPSSLLMLQRSRCSSTQTVVNKLEHGERKTDYSFIKMMLLLLEIDIAAGNFCSLSPQAHFCVPAPTVKRLCLLKTIKFI